MVVSWSRVSIWSIIYVLRRIPVSHSTSIEVLVRGNVSNSSSICYAVGTRSLGLRFGDFSGSFLVCLFFLQLKKPFLERIHRVLFLKFMVFDALYHSLQCSQLLVVNIILQQMRYLAVGTLHKSCYRKERRCNS